jgi:hypothetical protein
MNSKEGRLIVTFLVQDLRHPDHGYRGFVGKRHDEAFSGAEPVFAVQRLACQSRDQLEPRKAIQPCRTLAGPHDLASDSAARPVGMHKESADPRRFDCRVQQRIVLVRRVVAAKGSSPATPSAATHDLKAGVRHKIGAVTNELRVDAEDRAERPLDLFDGMIFSKQRPDRFRNKNLEGRDVVQSSLPNCDLQRDPQPRILPSDS